MKVAIQGLGEVPKPVELVLEREKPGKSYLIASEYQLNYLCSEHDYEESNEEVIKSKAEQSETELVIKQCDPFDLDKISDTVGEILQELGSEVDEIVINYTAGSANTRLVLGMTGLTLARIYPTKLLYAIEYPEGTKVIENKAEKLQDIYNSLNQLL